MAPREIMKKLSDRVIEAEKFETISQNQFLSNVNYHDF